MSRQQGEVSDPETSLKFFPENEEAKEILRNNPHGAAEYDRTFGPGKAAKVLKETETKPKTRKKLKRKRGG